MAYQDLEAFAKELERRKLLTRISEPISSVLEITEVHRRVLETQGPAILFENVITENGPNKIPVLVNLFGTEERIELGFGLEAGKLNSLAEKLAFLKQPEPPNGFSEALKMAPIIKDVFAMNPRILNLKGAKCHEVIITGNDIDLRILPVQTCWPSEPAPLITWPLVITKSPYDGQKINVGVYRMQILDQKRTIIRWLDHRGGSLHYKEWCSQDQKMPVAVVIGSDPATILAAVTPIPDNISEFQYSGLLRGSKLDLVKCVSIPMYVPANAEIVLEGYVEPGVIAPEGPYGDHTGYYNSIEEFPIFTITAITMKKQPIYLSTYTGKPPDEPSIIGIALNKLLLPILKQQFPELVDFWLPPEGCSYRIAIVSIKKQYPGHASRIAMGIWSYLRQFLYTKFIIVVDDDINIHDWKEVMWAVSTRMDFARDIIVIDNTPIDYLDFASCKSGLGGKLAFDATNKIGTETSREWGRPIKMDQEIIDIINSKWHMYNL